MIEPFKNWGQFILANLIIGVVCCFVFVDNPFDSLARFLIGTFWGMAIFITQWVGHSYIQSLIAKRFPWLEFPVQRMIYTVVSVVVYSVVAFVAVQIAMSYLVFGEVPAYLLQFRWRAWGVPISISFFISIITAAIGFFSSWKKSVIEKEHFKREMLTYKYEALRNQINPHFMFNSLNVLSDLVYADQQLAVKFIHQFSDIYRYVLDSRQKELVSLTEEMAFVEKYLFLLQTRFENKLEINVDVHPDKNDLIVPLSLQLLIENAVKHNIVSSESPLNITVEKQGDSLIVSNPIRPKRIGENSKKIGLKNLKQQFSYFTDNAIAINTDNDTFTVTLPLLKKIDS